MSVYKMPIVCKDVYIPFNQSSDDGLSLDQYKEKYGIDLQDYFVFGDGSGSIVIKNSLNRYYVVLNNQRVLPLISIFLTPSQSNVITGIDILSFNTETEALSTTIEGFTWDYEAKTLQSYSF